MEDSPLSKRVIGCAIEVSRHLGCGFAEKVYENALMVELVRAGIRAEQQKPVLVRYRGAVVGDYVVDILVEEGLLVEVKALDRFSPLHDAQVMNYLRATGCAVALLLNFGRPQLGIRRLVWHHNESDRI
ncbi:MAG: GxxExxY protein [Rhodanobacteraceae bacterium]|nr:GxxExxY protein [Rhodanobacteraceae bacterium]